MKKIYILQLKKVKQHKNEASQLIVMTTENSQK